MRLRPSGNQFHGNEEADPRRRDEYGAGDVDVEHVGPNESAQGDVEAGLRVGQQDIGLENESFPLEKMGRQ